MDEAAKRKERLQALREAASLTETSENQGQTSEVHDLEERKEEQKEGTVKFKNYLPRDSHLNERLPPPERPQLETPTAISTQTAQELNDDPISSIAPKKPNWDLRRDVAKKLEKLERRTQRALVELMYEEETKRQLETEAEGE